MTIGERKESQMKRIYMIAYTGSGKTIIALITSILLFKHNIEHEKKGAGSRCIVVITGLHKIVARQYF